MDHTQIEQELSALPPRHRFKLALSQGISLADWWNTYLQGMSPSRFSAILCNQLPGCSLHIEKAYELPERMGLSAGGRKEALQCGITVPVSQISARMSLLNHEGQPYLSLWDGSRGGRQSVGHVRILMRNIAQFCDERHISQVHLVAARIGAYTWANFGFVPTKRAWMGAGGGLQKLMGADGGLRKRMQRRLEELKANIPEDTYQNISALLRSDDPKTIWTIAEQRELVPTSALIRARVLKEEKGMIPLGKALLINQQWAGALDLGDPEARAKFEAYTDPARTRHTARVGAGSAEQSQVGAGA